MSAGRKPGGVAFSVAVPARREPTRWYPSWTLALAVLAWVAVLLTIHTFARLLP